MKKLIMSSFLVVPMVFLSSCSSTTKSNEKVISRINNLNERPAWLDESRSFLIKDGKVVSLGMTTVPGDSRVEAAFRIAESDAKRNITSAIQQKLSYVFQIAEEGTSIDSNQVQAISTEASKRTTSHIQPDQRYWEKVVIPKENGQSEIRYRVFATVTMPEHEFKKAVSDALTNNKTKISADLAQKADLEWKKISEEQ